MKGITRRNLGRQLPLLALIPLTALPAIAEETTAIDDIVVTASRTEERAIDVPITTQIITRDMIEMSGAVDLGELISKYITGHVHKYTGILNSIGLRGFRSDAHGADLAGYVLLLIDGHRVGTGNAAKINMDRIERIEVIKGPSSALYGSAAIGGVINLITKKGEGDFTGSISADYGSFDYYKGGVSLGGDASDRISFFLNASVESSDDIETPSYGTVYNSGYDKKNVGGNVVYTLNENHQFRLGGNFSDLESESSSWLNGYHSSYDPSATQDNDKSIGYADLEYNGDYLDNTVHWKGLLYYLWDKNLWNWGEPDPKSYQTKYIDTTVGTDQQFSWQMNDWNKVVLGFTLESLEKESTYIANYQSSMPYTPNLDYENEALFLQDSLDLLDNQLNIIFAARYDRFDVTTKQGETGDYNDFVEQSEDYDHISPKIGAGLKLFDELLRLRANLGEGFKSPTADELAADYTHSSTGVHYVGNPDLDPETSMTYDVGFDVYLNILTLQADYFHTDYEDKITSSSSVVNGVYTTTYINSGDAEIDGLEFSLDLSLDELMPLPFSAKIYSTMVFNINKEDKETGEDLQYISDYEIKSGINFGFNRINAMISHVLVGPQMIYSYVTYTDVEKDSFDFWDITVRYQISDHWQARASILNLFDQDVEWVEGYPMAEQNFRIGLTYTF